MPNDRLVTGVAGIDRILGGGIEMDGLTELYGEGGSGKTLLCIELTVRVARAGRWVIYIDTEGVSLARLEAVAGNQTPAVLEHLLLSSPKSLAEQTNAVRSACLMASEGSRPMGLIVLDSGTMYYRLTLGSSDEDDARQVLERQLADLLATSLHAAIPVVFTNQVWRRVTDGTLEPLGGSFVNHVAKTILRFERLRGPHRRVTLMKHRSLPESSAEFEITDSRLV
jgi:DNA repair protein RadB